MNNEGFWNLEVLSACNILVLYAIYLCIQNILKCYFCLFKWIIPYITGRALVYIYSEAPVIYLKGAVWVSPDRCFHDEIY